MDRRTAMPTSPRLLPLGDAAWTVQFGDRIDPELHARVVGLADRLGELAAAGEWPAEVEWVPGFCALTVHFDPLRTEGDALGKCLLRLAEEAPARHVAGRRWAIPVCFDADLAPDLAEVAAVRGLALDTAIGLLTSSVFRVYVLGFLPGFPYLGGLPEALAMPRLSTPRARVPARSLAIAGQMCGIYPWESPGGWRLVGRTPVPCFDAQAAGSPALFVPGDEVSFRAIDRAVFEHSEREYARGQGPEWTQLLAPERG